MAEEHSVEVTVSNRMGFHVRPVQRFAEMARSFRADVEVEMRNRNVPGKSVINLVSLGGRCGDSMRITARGEDARQCVNLLAYLAGERFFVEDNLEEDADPERHIDRLARVAGSFDSRITMKLDGHTVDAKDPKAIAAAGLEATSRPEFEIEGEDVEQARAVLDNLVESCFYVEDRMADRGRKGN